MPTTTSVQVRYADIDTLGHVNNVAYYALMESGRVGFFSEAFQPMYASMVIVHSECDYLAEIPVGTPSVDVTVSVEKVGTTSFTLLHEITRDGTTRARGRTVHVVLGEDRRPRPLTDDERAHLQGR